MRQRTIESQTTRPCCHQPKPSDYKVRLREQLWINFIDSLKALAFLGTGFVIYIALITLVHYLGN